MEKKSELEVPLFHGDKDEALDWLLCLKEHFRKEKTWTEDKWQIAMSRFRGSTIKWFRTWKCRDFNNMWKDFLMAFITKYLPGRFDLIDDEEDEIINDDDEDEENDADEEETEMAESEVANGNVSVEEIDVSERVRDDSEKKTMEMTAAKGAEIEEDENEGAEIEAEKDGNGEFIVEVEDFAEPECLETESKIGKEIEKPRCLMETGMEETVNPSSVLITGMGEIPAKVPSSSYEEELDLGVMMPTLETGIGVVRIGGRKSETLLRRCEEAELVAKGRDEQQRTGVPKRDWIGNDSKVSFEYSLVDDKDKFGRHLMELQAEVKGLLSDCTSEDEVGGEKFKTVYLPPLPKPPDKCVSRKYD